MVIDEFGGTSRGGRRRSMVVGEYKEDEVSCMAVHGCEEASIAVSLLCARNRGMNNNNVNVCARNEDGARMNVCEAKKYVGGFGGWCWTEEGRGC